MTRSTCAQALFASWLQPSQQPSADEVAAAVEAALHRHGGLAGCAAQVATEYGEHPEAAAARMRWALALSAQRPVLAQV